MMKTITTSILVLILFMSYGQDLHTRNKDLPCLNKHYNFVVHAVYDNLRATHEMEDLNDAIAAANKYFAPICISFSSCFVDTVFNYNYNALVPGVELQEISREHNAENRINLYLITDSLINASTGGLCSGTVGGLLFADIYLKSLSALSHEIGHFFGLHHTFRENGLELVDGSNCETAGDSICDTPADPFNPGELHQYLRGCTFVSEKKDANDQYYQPDVGNIMSYYGEDCGFTRQQYLKMAENFLSANRLNW